MAELDTPTDHVDILRMDFRELEVHLAGIRERRLKPIRVYEAAEQQRLKARHDRINERLEKKIATIKKKVESLDAAIEAIEKLSLEVQALQLQLEAETPSP